MHKNFWKLVDLYCFPCIFAIVTNGKFIEMKNPIEEARRYVSNAKDVIKNANYDRKFKMYMDGKYVKMAGDTLWKGCLIALDAVLKNEIELSALITDVVIPLVKVLLKPVKVLLEAKSAKAPKDFVVISHSPVDKSITIV